MSTDRPTIDTPEVPLSEAREALDREIAYFAACGAADGSALSANSCSEMAGWLNAVREYLPECDTHSDGWPRRFHLWRPFGRKDKR